MEYKKVTKENLKTAIEIQQQIFPKSFGEKDLNSYVNNTLMNQLLDNDYWIVDFYGKHIGICGIYSFKEYPKDMWLGWFGVLEKERRKGYATQMLKFCYDKAKQMGYDTFRLYTHEKGKEAAIRLYQNFKMEQELYENDDDKYQKNDKIYIFSKNLKLGKPKPWGNRNLHISVRLEENNI